MPMTSNPMRSGSAGGPGNYTPGISRWAVAGAALQLLATCLVLIGSALWAGDTWTLVSAGAIVLCIGFTLWGLAMLIALGVYGRTHHAS